MPSLTIMQNRGLIRELLVEAKPKLAEESYRLPEIFYRQVDKYFPGHVSLSRECVPPSRCRGGAARLGAGRQDRNIASRMHFGLERSSCLFLAYEFAVALCRKGPVRLTPALYCFRAQT